MKVHDDDTGRHLRNDALEYAATGQADYAQFFTTPDCTSYLTSDGKFMLTQVWVAVPTLELPS